jgi:uncharacterized protein YigE (DUF2233 family)
MKSIVVHTLVLGFLLQNACLANPPWEIGSREEIPTGIEGVKRSLVKFHSFGFPPVGVAMVSFDPKQFEFKVLDQHGPDRTTLVAMIGGTNAVAGINASYFHPDYTPLGLVVSKGRELHGKEKADLLGGVAGMTDEGPFLVRSEAFPPGGTVLEAVQAGPFLVEKGKQVEGLNDERQARRSVIWTDGKGLWGILVTEPITLFQLAQALSLPGMGIDRALNLDGGSSTAFWAKGVDRDFSISEYGTVRNFMLVVPRTRSAAGKEAVAR